MKKVYFLFQSVYSIKGKGDKEALAIRRFPPDQRKTNFKACILRVTRHLMDSSLIDDRNFRVSLIPLTWHTFPSVSRTYYTFNEVAAGRKRYCSGTDLFTVRRNGIEHSRHKVPGNRRTVTASIATKSSIPRATLAFFATCSLGHVVPSNAQWRFSVFFRRSYFFFFNEMFAHNASDLGWTGLSP